MRMARKSLTLVSAIRDSKRVISGTAGVLGLGGCTSAGRTDEKDGDRRRSPPFPHLTLEDGTPFDAPEFPLAYGQ
jgi:hypothetical protein